MVGVGCTVRVTGSVEVGEAVADGLGVLVGAAVRVEETVGEEVQVAVGAGRVRVELGGGVAVIVAVGVGVLVARKARGPFASRPKPHSTPPATDSSTTPSTTQTHQGARFPLA